MAVPRLALPFWVVVVLLGVLLLLAARPSTQATENWEEQRLWSPYWTLQPGFRSTLEMKNNRAEDTLTVNVSLYFAAGEEYYLSSLEVGPRQTALIDLNHAIESLPAAVAARASNEGTAEVRFVAPNAQALMGSMSVSNPEKGIAWNFRLYPRDADLPVMPLRGLFWFYDRQTDGFVAVQNVSEEFLSVRPHFQVAGERYSLSSVSLAPGQGYKLELHKNLRALGLEAASAGGIEFTFDAPPDAIKAHGVLYNGRGFSAEVDFNPFERWEEPRLATLRTPRFALGPADARLGLPSPTTFESFLALHNFNAHSLPLSLSLGYTSPGHAAESEVSLALAPGESRVIPVSSLIGSSLAPGVSWAWLELSYSDRHNGLVAALVSVTQDGEHSLRSVLNWVEGSASEGWYWRADANYNTLLGILNTDSEEARVAISLDYYTDGRRRSYDLPERTLPARASDLVDVGAIIAAGVPDADGEVIPPGVSVGGYRVRKTGARSETVLTTEALLINRQTKAYETYYNTCCPIYSVSFTPTGLSGNPGGYGQITVTGQDNCSGAQFNLTSSASYTSRNTAIARMTSTAGQVSYVSPGSTAVDACVQYRVWKAFINPCYVVTTCDDTPTQVLSVSQSPTLFNMSTGDTKQITVTIDPNNITVNASFSTTLTTNPDSSCAVTLTIPGKSGQGTISHEVTASVAGCSGIFSTRASANNVQSSNTTTVRVPPQVLIQMMQAEAGGTGNSTLMQGLGDVAQNRIHSSIFNPPFSNYQNTIVSGQFATTSTTTGVQPQLDLSVNVFVGLPGRFCNALAFWTPTATQWQAVQAAISSGTTAFPSGTGAPTFSSWSTQNQQILFVSSVGTQGNGAPNFLFLANRSSTQPAAVNASCTP